MSDRITDYEPQRAKYKAWAKKHYIDEFGLSGRILDAGCGDSFWSSVFRDYGMQTIGIDCDRKALKRGEDRYPGIDIYCMQIEDATDDELGRFNWAFARGISPFYAEFLSPCIVIMRVLFDLADRVLLGVWSDQSGNVDDNGVWHYPASAYHHIIKAAGGTTFKTVTVGNYIQIGAKCVT